MPIQSIDPHTLTLRRSYPENTPDECSHIIERCCTAQSSWISTSIEERTALAEALAEQLMNRLDTHATIITSEMGKPVAESRGEVQKCATLCRYYARESAAALADRQIETDYPLSLVRYEPLGIILAIMPWNFPYWQVFRAAIPAMMAGNAVILKHASNTTECAYAIEAVFLEAGFPEDLFRVLAVRGENTASLIMHPHVAAVTFTGSNAAGEKIAAIAGAQVKKTVLELGGSDPSIVLADADLELAATKCVQGRMLNAGQSCIAAKRILVHESVAEPFVKLVTRKISEIVVGNPMESTTQMGPLATEAIRREIDHQVCKSIEAGATCLLGGHPLDRTGCYYAPTLLTDVKPGMPVWNEETFGPVMCVTTFHDEPEAIRLANLTQWGLGSSVYSRDTDRAFELGKKIQVGTCAINDFVKSDTRISFGGVKKSGYGRELGIEGIREFTNIKAYNITK